MSENAVVTYFENSDPIKASYEVKAGLARLLRGGVVVEVSGPEQARQAEAAGAVAVAVAHNAPKVNIAGGSVGRMSDPDLIKVIKKVVTVPVVGRARIGHFVEAQVLEAVGVDFIDESEVLTRADDVNYINKHHFRVPFICGCRDLGDALCRIAEGATMVRTQGDSDGQNIVETVRQTRAVLGEIRRLQSMDKDELFSYSKQIRVPYELVKLTKRLGRLPVVGFAAGRVSTPADSALMMQLGCDGVFVSSGLSGKRIAAIVKAVTHYNDSQILAEASTEYAEET